MPSFATPVHLASRMQVASVDTTSAQDALDDATATIVEYVGWPVFETVDDTHTEDGSGNVIFLPTMFLTAVDSVVDNGVTLDPSTYTAEANGTLRLRSSRFSYGLATVVVTFTHGWQEADVPRLFRRICLDIATRIYGNPDVSQSEQVGGVAESWAVSAANYTWGAALLPSEQRDLTRYALSSVTVA